MLEIAFFSRILRMLSGETTFSHCKTLEFAILIYFVFDVPILFPIHYQ